MHLESLTDWRRRLSQSIRRHPLLEVRGVYHLTGANDCLRHVAARESEHLREFVLTAFATRPEVAHLETSLIFSHRRNPVFGIGLARADASPTG